MRTLGVFAAALITSATLGCALQEVRSKTKVGPEWQHSGTSDTDSVRWSVEQGFDFKWDKGIGTGVSYRRRDVDDGSGNNDNGVWFDISFPIWKAKKKEAAAERIEVLERRLAQLEVELAGKDLQTAAGRDPVHSGNGTH